MNIKLCGLMSVADVAAVNEVDPEYIGFVFAPGRHQIDRTQAKLLAQALHENIQKVGVFVNASIGDIVQIVQDGSIDLIQLHGQESKAYVKELSESTTCPLIKALDMTSIPITTLPCVMESFAQAGISLFLLDQGKGGTGQCFDWSILPFLPYPYFLAGGIQLNNVLEAMQCSAIGLDMSSGIETDGKKDPLKIKKICKLIRTEKENFK